MQGFSGFDCGRGYPSARVCCDHGRQWAEGIDVDQSGTAPGHQQGVRGARRFEQVESALDGTNVAVATQYREGHRGRPGADPLRQHVVATTGSHPGTQRACEERPRREPLAEFDEQQCLVVQRPA